MNFATLIPDACSYHMAKQTLNICKHFSEFFKTRCRLATRYPKYSIFLWQRYGEFGFFK